MARGSKTIAILSDLHVGSKYALCSDEPELDDGGGYRPSKIQKKLFNAYVESIDELTTKPDILVINGEPIDGSNPRTLGESCWSTNHFDQMNDAEKLVKMFPHLKLYLIRGSGYHVTRESTNFENFFQPTM